MLRTCLVALVLAFAAPAAAQDVPDPPADDFDLAAAIADGPSLSADDAARRAVDAAPSLERARALSRAAEATVARARAAMLPRLELSATYQHVDGFDDGSISLGDPESLEAARMLADRVSDPAARTLWQGQLAQQGGSVSIEIPRDRVAFSARLTWPVSDMFFAMMPAVEAAEAGAEAQELQTEAAAAGVRRSAREAYLTLVRARGALAVADEGLTLSRAQLDQVQAAVQAGFMTEADRLGAEARVAELERARASAEAGVEIADAALRMLMDAEPGAPFGVALDAVPEDATADPDAAVEARAEIRALRRALDAQRAAARAEDARGYPHLALYAGADLANPNRYQIPPQQEFTPSWEMGVMLSWAPNDTLTAVHRGDELGAQQAATEAQITQIERMVRLEVTQAQARLRAARRGIDAAHAAQSAAQAAYESRLAQVRAGAATTAELFAAEGQLHRARLAALDAEVALRLAATQLAHAAGAL